VMITKQNYQVKGNHNVPSPVMLFIRYTIPPYSRAIVKARVHELIEDVITSTDAQIYGKGEQIRSHGIREPKYTNT
jgi:hypothetical protein